MQNQLFYKICFIFNTLLSVQIKVKTKLFSTYQIENYRANAVRLGFFFGGGGWLTLIKQANNVPPIFSFIGHLKRIFSTKKSISLDTFTRISYDVFFFKAETSSFSKILSCL